MSVFVFESGLCADCADSLYESRSTTAIAMKQEEHLLDLKIIYSSSLSFSLSLSRFDTLVKNVVLIVPTYFNDF